MTTWNASRAAAWLPTVLALGAATAQAATAPKHHEAEKGQLAGGLAVATDHTGFTGTGFVGGFIDTNKGNAELTFSVKATKAGDYTLSLRYANGTGSAKTLSLLVDGAPAGQATFGATATWDTWGTQSNVVTLAAGAHKIAYKFDTTDSGNINLDALDVAPPTKAGGKPATPDEAETWFISNGPAVSTTLAGYTGSGYVSGFGAAGARAIRAVVVAADGPATATLRFQNASGNARDLDLWANAAKVGKVTLPAGAGWQKIKLTLPLRAGLNSVGLQAGAQGGDVAIDSLKVVDDVELADRGATLPYTEYEAEAASTTGSVLAPGRTYMTVQSESSGRSAVRLSQTGQKLSFTLKKATNSVVVRYSIPDTPDGAGQDATLALYADGKKLRDLALTSSYSWVYGAYPYRGLPADGSPHHFYDEVHALIGEFPAGTVLTLQKDATNSAAYYDIDLIDTEEVGPALKAPEGALPVTNFGATADGSTDSTTAFRNAIAAASAQGVPVWVPAGTFRITSLVNVANVTIRGAGPWYSTVALGLDGKGGFFATGSNVTLADLAILGNIKLRDPDTQRLSDAPIEGNFGTGSLLQNLWIEHGKVGMWPDSGTDGLYALGLRIRDTFADGINIHANTRNCRIDQSALRNTGDDALAMFSEGAAVTNSAFTYDTVQLPLLANGVGLYGGTGNRVEHNLIIDTVTSSAGIEVGTRFTPIPLSGTISVQHNTLLRTGGFVPEWSAQIGGLWIFADQSDIATPIVIDDIAITDSTYQGVLVSFQRNINGVSLNNAKVSGSGAFGLQFNAAGSASVANTTVTNSAQAALDLASTFTLTRGAGNSGF